MASRRSRNPANAYVYLLVPTPYGGIAKIGCAHRPDIRAHELSAELGIVARIAASAECAGVGTNVERLLQRALASRHAKGEWFYLTEKEVADLVGWFGSFNSLLAELALLACSEKFVPPVDPVLALASVGERPFELPF